MCVTWHSVREWVGSFVLFFFSFCSLFSLAHSSAGTSPSVLLPFSPWKERCLPQISRGGGIFVDRRGTEKEASAWCGFFRRQAPLEVGGWFRIAGEDGEIGGGVSVCVSLRFVVGDFFLQDGELPVVVFCFSRRKCEVYAQAMRKLDVVLSHNDRSKIHLFVKVSAAPCSSLYLNTHIHTPIRTCIHRYVDTYTGTYVRVHQTWKTRVSVCILLCLYVCVARR